MVVLCLVVYSCSSLDMHSIELIVLSSLVSCTVVCLIFMVYGSELAFMCLHTYNISLPGAQTKSETMNDERNR